MNTNDIIITKRKNSPFIVQLTLFTISRTVINTGVRMIYPLLPVFARSVNVELTTIAFILTIAQLMGLTAPFLGTLSERYGRRFTILLGLLLFAGGMLTVYVSPNFIGLAAAMLIAALGKLAHDPAIQAYIADRTPYEKRGMVIGILEFGWSGAFLIGVPAMTWLIANYNWQAPFGVLAMITAVVYLAGILIVEPDRPNVINRVSLFKAIRISLDNRSAVAGLVMGFGMASANQLVSVVFGSWIELSFGIALSALAAASVVIGVSELVGEGAVTVFSDRFGKRKLVMVSLLGNIVACVILPFMGFQLSAALFGLFLFYLTFETAVVATIPLSTELSPNARAMYLTVYVAEVTLGRASSTMLAPYLFNHGLLMNCIIAIVFNLVAFAAVWKFIKVK